MSLSNGSIRKNVLFPIVVAMVVLSGMFLIILDIENTTELNEYLEHTRNMATRMYQNRLKTDSDLMFATLDALEQKDELRQAFAARNRGDLLRMASPLLDMLRRDSHISHLNFVLPDGRKFLATHSPHSPILPTTNPVLQAVVQSGKPAYGVRLGQDGFLGLRAAMPWKADGHLIGYLEMGGDVEQIIQEVADTLQLRMMVFIHKKYLNQKAWQQEGETSRRQNRMGWDTLPLSVPLKGYSDLTPELKLFLADRVGLVHDMAESVAVGPRMFHVVIQPLENMEGAEVGDMVILTDTTDRHAALARTRLWVMGGILMVAGLLAVGFWFYLGRVEETILFTEENLLQAHMEWEQALKDNQQRIQEIFDNNPDILIAVDVHWHITHVNPKAQQALGLTGGEVLGHDLWDTFPELASYFFKPLKKAMANMALVVEEGFYPPLNSWYSVRAFPIRNGIAVNLLDITSQKNAQAELTRHRANLERLVEERTDNLKKSEERFRNLMEWSLQGVSIVQHKRMLFTNQAMADLFGFDHPEEMTGIDPLDTLVAPEYLPRQREIRDEVLAGLSVSHEAEVEGVRRDGTRFWLMMLRKRVVWEGEPAIMLIASDFTGRKKAEEELQSAKEAAEAASHAKSQFLSTMSHDLRTPLNAILGFAQLMETDPEQPLTQEQTESVAYIKKGGALLLNLIDEVLDLAKIESGRIHLSLEDVDPVDVVYELVHMTQPMAVKQGIILDNRFQVEGCPLVRVDRTRFRQIVLNFLSNGVKYNRQGGTLSILWEKTGDRLKVLVRDTGPGISPESMKELFQPFNRLGAEASEVEGTGIGLTISKRLTELMGGEIGAESQPGRGSTFWVAFPISGGTTETLQPETPTPDIRAVLPAAGTVHTLLYVEDNPANLSLMEKIIARLPHYRLITAHNGEIGLELAQAHHPDVILMDINLPGLNGFQALEKLKENPSTRDIPVLALSANAMAADIQKGLEAGFFDYLTKPLKIPYLESVLEKIVTKNQKD